MFNIQQKAYSLEVYAIENSRQLNFAMHITASGVCVRQSIPCLWNRTSINYNIVVPCPILYISVLGPTLLTTNYSLLTVADLRLGSL